MGSACTFPVEALFFWGLLRGNIDTDVWVYGDDIIIDRDYVEDAISILESVGLKVNVQKSCYKTHFCESCGEEYFHGYSVGYTKVRKLPSETISSKRDQVSFAERIAHDWGLSIGLKVLDAVDAGQRPTPTSNKYRRPGVFYHQDVGIARNDVFYKRRFNKDLHYVEHKIPVTSTTSVASRSEPRFHRCEMMRKILTNDAMTEVGCYTGTATRTRWSFVEL
jgi:hypothetical protein